MTVHELVAAAFKEDIPTQDITTDGLNIANHTGYAFLIAKADIKLSGSDFFEQSILAQAPQAQIKWLFKDGDTVLKNQKVCSIHGNLIPILKAERVALNFLGYFSGIATTTHLYVSACGDSPVKILDTRKTLAPYRPWIKKAVVDGGGHNHRFNLSDAVLIKENHIRIAGSIDEAVKRLREAGHEWIETETSTLAEVLEAVKAKVNRILLDNMDDAGVARCLEVIPEEIETEVSGNISVQRLQVLSRLPGLDYISVGSLTHSAPCADLSLLFDF